MKTRRHATTGEKLRKLIYRGFYYPVLGSNNGWVNGRTKQLFERRIGGWKNCEKWWSFSYGVKVKLFNPDKPYKQFVLDAVEAHSEMKIVKSYFDDCGREVPRKTKDSFSMTSVYTKHDEHIGDIRNGYDLLHLEDFRSYDKEDSKQICRGYDKVTDRVCAWSHRAMICFGIGDKLFESKFGDENTPFNQHGKITIKTHKHMWQSALNFANYVS